MDYTWASVDELKVKLHEVLSGRHPGEVTSLNVALEGDTIVLSGEVASEGCRGDAKRLTLAFEGIFKVLNLLEVAAFLEGASDPSAEDDFFGSYTEPPAEGTDGDQPRRSTPRGYPRQRSATPNRTEMPKRRSSNRGTEFALGYTIADGGGDAEPEPAEEEVSRYPTVRKAGEITAGAAIELTVDLGEAPVSGSERVKIGKFPAGWTQIEVSVQIFGDWLQDWTPEESSITLRRRGPNSPAKFTCTVSSQYQEGAPAELQIYFLHGTRICGSMRVDLAVGQPAPEGASGGEPKSPAATTNAEPTAVTLAFNSPGPALTVMIADRDGTQHWTWKAFGPGGYKTGSGEVHLGASAKAFAETLLNSCPDLTEDYYRRTMRGIGETIWQRTPESFRQAYLACRQSLGSDFPIQFNSDDPHVPWEMMKPNVDDGSVDHLYLEHPVARWPLNTDGVLRSTFPIGDILSFVPDYKTQKLASAAAESAWICSSLKAIRMQPSRASFLDILDGKRPGTIRLIHFAGHGRADTGTNDGGIDLEDGPVGLMEVNQSSIRLGRRDGPLIVLNACETSSGAEMLGMNTGWGAAVAATGFGGLIAPLWAVQDAMAFTMVKDSLPQLVSGKATLGSALRDARRKNAETSVAALAYLTHGDVMARFARS